ncbi:FtsX-like permease family protein [Epibacterium sp. MM17-32]|uniref:ABC transporter permease n=1 Tax=Epibacterium sp. MM17-32 TaxID=2917734 RepID=UPI001EF3D958|nr:FtsX-like permease family protein [Epibacterium sp. MM17-32]MCG7626560.1 FtsX-like permease family protein [Epibacterium sp. MM17-32]
MRLTLATLLRHWRRMPLQLGLMIAGLALATALWSAVQAINGEARASYARAVEQLGSAQLPALTAPDGRIPLATYVSLRRAGWQLSPVLEGRWSPGRRPVTLMGVDVLSHPVTAAMVAAEAEADPDAPPFATVMQRETLFAHPDRLPDLEGSGYRLLPLPHLPPDVVIGDLALVATLLDRPDALTRLLILPQQPMGLTPLAELAPSLRVGRVQDGVAGDPQRLTRSFHLNLSAFGLLSFAVGLFIVQGSVTLGLEQRRGQIQTLRCLGVPLSQLMLALAIELVVFALVAGLIGLVIGYGLAGLLLPDVTATLRGLYGAPVDGELTLRPGWVLSGLAMSVGGTLLAGTQAFLALRRMARSLSQSPVSGARRGAHHWLRLAAGGLVLMGLGTLIGGIWPGLLTGFVWLAGLMVGAALLLPALLHAASHLIPTGPDSPLRAWLIADSRLQLPGLSLSLMALCLAVATNIGVGTMVSSFRLTFVDWIDQRLLADLYVQPETETMEAELMRWAQQAGVRALPRYQIDSRSGNAPLRLFGITDDPRYAEEWPLLRSQPDVWTRLFDQGEILINEQLAHRQGLSPGAVVELAPGWSARVAGVYADYGNPDGQAYMSIDAMRDRDMPMTLSQIGLVAPADTAIEDLAQELRAALALPPGAVIRRDAIRATSTAIFDRTFVVTGALNVLTLAVAGFAMLTSFLSQWSRRLPQLSPLWAMGVTRRQLALCEVLRSLGFAAGTFLLALPLGLLLAWILLAHINLEAFGWRVPMTLFPDDWLRLFALTLLAAAVAALGPATRLLRLSPARLLGVFSHDR